VHQQFGMSSSSNSRSNGGGETAVRTSGQARGSGCVRTGTAARGLGSAERSGVTPATQALFVEDCANFCRMFDCAKVSLAEHLSERSSSVFFGFNFQPIDRHI
jgi:hypothetical protein